MAYGQTGAGKTFTMTGTSETHDNRGIVPRALSQLFQHIDENPDYYFCVRYSCFKYLLSFVLCQQLFNTEFHVLICYCILLFLRRIRLKIGTEFLHKN